MKPMDIYIANVPFSNGTDSKKRPALIVKVKHDKVNIFKITSKYKDKSDWVKRFYYPIENWKRSGLRKQSYVDIHRTYSISKKYVDMQNCIGTLTDYDRLHLANFIKTFNERNNATSN